MIAMPPKKQAKLTAFFGNSSAEITANGGSRSENEEEGPSEKGLSTEREQGHFQRKWLSLYSRLRFDEAVDKMYCQICSSAGKKKRYGPVPRQLQNKAPSQDT